MRRDFSHNHPIILGLHGRALTGKTVTAEGIAPQAQFHDRDGVRWDHLFYALPLYAMATARQKISGHSQEDRKLYAIHETLLDIFGASPLYGAPPYARLVDMVQEIFWLPCDPEGTKPRSFLQQSGTICRDFDPNCFVGWMNRKIKTLHREYILSEQQTDDDDMEEDLDTVKVRKPFGIVISDIRFENEAALVKEQPNGVLVELTASPEVLQNRSIERDGKTLSKTQASHESENQTIPEEWFDATVDSSDMSVEEQVEAVRQILYTTLEGIPAHAESIARH